MIKLLLCIAILSPLFVYGGLMGLIQAEEIRNNLDKELL